MGVSAFKNPLDSWIYQEIIYETKPDTLIEIGSAKGGSTLYFAHLLDLVGKGQVISIDIDRSAFQVSHPRIVQVTGDSSSPAIVKRVKELCRGKSVLVIHDGEHTKEQVLKDLHAYAELVNVGSYFIVEDGIVDLFRPRDGLGWFREGPMPAIEQFVRENPKFVIDPQRERYLLTYNPCGYLRRVR
jgi:cephalosporin hydroxylase